MDGRGSQLRPETEPPALPGAVYQDLKKAVPDPRVVTAQIGGVTTRGTPCTTRMAGIRPSALRKGTPPGAWLPRLADCRPVPPPERPPPGTRS